MKTFLFRSAAGIGIGALLMIIITNSIYLAGNETLDGAIFFKNSIGMLFSGWFFAVTPLYFELTKLKLYQQTLLHFVTVSLLYFIVAGWVGWMPFTLGNALLFIGGFIGIYLIIWLIFYLYFRKIATQLNEELSGE